MKWIRRVLLALVVCLVVAGVCFWVIVLEPMHRYGQCNHRIKEKFASLKRRRPPNLTRPQWANVVAWTLNAGGNCLGYDSHWPDDLAGFADVVKKTEQFEKELDQRLEGPVDMGTIDWIWDELVRITHHGKKYSDNYRPTFPERLEEFRKGNPWTGVEVN